MSNVDIYVITKELNNVFLNGFISNIYELPSTSSKTLILKMRTKAGKRFLIIDPKKRINITQYQYPVPSFPSQFMGIICPMEWGLCAAEVIDLTPGQSRISCLKTSILLRSSGLLNNVSTWSRLKPRSIFRTKDICLETIKVQRINPTDMVN